MAEAENRTRSAIRQQSLLPASGTADCSPFDSAAKIVVTRVRRQRAAKCWFPHAPVHRVATRELAAHGLVYLRTAAGRSATWSARAVGLHAAGCFAPIHLVQLGTIGFIYVEPDAHSA